MATSNATAKALGSGTHYVSVKTRSWLTGIVFIIFFGCAVLSLDYFNLIASFSPASIFSGEISRTGTNYVRSSHTTSERSSSVLKQIEDLFGKRIIDDVNDLSESRPGGDNDIRTVFPGIREWHEHWAYAERRGRDDIRPEESDNNKAHVYDEYVTSMVESLSEATLRHMQDMKTRYTKVAALPDFYARGLGWVMDRLEMVLTVVIAGNFATMEGEGPSGEAPLSFHSGQTSIYIVDTVGKRKCGRDDHDEKGNESWIEEQPPLTMWVRAYGKSPSSGEGEIFSGTALPHKLKSSSRCAWKYEFEPTYPGIYVIHVKVLNFNGFFDSFVQPCTLEAISSRNEQFDAQKVNSSIPGDLEALSASNYEFVNDEARNGPYLHHRGLLGFKLYDPEHSCCEACKRARKCKMFTAPGASNFDQCELYFDRIDDDIDFLDRESGLFLGRERNYSYVHQDPSEYYTNTRTRERRELVVSDYKPGGWPGTNPFRGFPPPIDVGKVTYFIGCGWSSTMTFESPCHYPTDDLVFGSGQKIEILNPDFNSAFTSSGPTDASTDDLRSCDLNDEKLDVANGRWVQHVYPDDSVCSRGKDYVSEGFRMHMLEYDGNLPPYCWHRDDLTAVSNDCAEGGCTIVIGHRWKTELKNQSTWFGMWEPHDCKYIDMGDNDIQQCIDRRNITSISVQGVSIANMLKGVVNQKMQNINMTSGGKTIVLNTLAFPHLLWHLSVSAFIEKLETEYPSVLDNAEAEHYWVSGFFYTSEREPYVQVDRSLQFSKIAYEILAPRGYHMINAIDVTRAFAYDTDGQNDGLHIGGPPLKAIVTKFFHHLCQNV